MRRSLTPLQLSEHEKVAQWLLAFLSGFEEKMQLLKKGFADNSPVVKKLQNMNDIGQFLKYSLQQGADLHNSKLERPEGHVESAETRTKWQKVYLGDR